ncbi:SDR family NAD(P)-dependent oxidoreductase [Streptomyces sp. NPDC058430]|uniref:SDR family NAD(P)-dependent oxidoreductase n=1 Tax=Streptomyces sp. NPDC058430 TaxID=3346495 RepID=UPI00365BE0E6
MVPHPRHRTPPRRGRRRRHPAPLHRTPRQGVTTCPSGSSSSPEQPTGWAARSAASSLAGPRPTLILHGRDKARLDELASALSDAPASVMTVSADFSELAQVHRLADEVAQLTDRVSVLVNNAGLGAGNPTARSGDCPLTDTSSGSPSTTSPRSP